MRGASRLSGITSQCIWRGGRRGKRCGEETSALEASTWSPTKRRRIELEHTIDISFNKKKTKTKTCKQENKIREEIEV